jgi:hypothetical protein
MKGSFGTKDHSADLSDGAFEAADTPAAVAPFTTNSDTAWDITDLKPITSCFVYCSGSITDETCNILAKVTF